MKPSTFFTFLSGAALGAMVALLLAPEKGSNTRKKLRRKLKEHGIKLSKEELSELINHLFRKEKAEEIAEVVE